MSKIPTNLAILVGGAVVAAGADTGVANYVYDAIRQYAEVDAYWLEEGVRAAGTGVGLIGGAKLTYACLKEGAQKILGKATALPTTIGLFGLTGLVALLADENCARHIYDNLMLYNFNMEQIETTVKALGYGGAIGSGLATGCLTIKEGLEKIFKKKEEN